MNKVIQRLIKYASPPLSRIIGSKRPPTADWRLDPRPLPPVKPFHPINHHDDSSTLGDLHDNDLRRKRHQTVEQKREQERNRGNTFNQVNMASQFNPEMDLSRPYRILSLDGGGVRGIVTVRMLMRIVEHNPSFLDNIDLICGTSVGGILSLLLAAGYSPKECDEIYEFATPHIFGHNPWRVINPTRSKYSDKAKQELMQHFFGERCMGDLEKTTAVIAFRLDGRKSQTHSFFNKEGWRPAVFSNMPQAAGVVEPDSDLKVWDAAMRTSAAPTFFPVFRGYTDGGIVANNPSILAVAKAMAHYPSVSPRSVAVLSLGSGSFPRHTNVLSSIGTNYKRRVEAHSRHFLHSTEKIADVDSVHGISDYWYSESDRNQLLRADWGIKQWMPFLIDLLLDGDSVTTEMVMHYLVGSYKMYHRLDPRMPKWTALDDVLGLPELKDFADSVDMTETFKFVDEHFIYDEAADSGMVHNALDKSSTYHAAWLRAAQSQAAQRSR